MRSKLDLTLVLWSCGHRALLEQTIPATLNSWPGQVLLVDYGCPEGAGGWATSLKHKRLRVLTVDAPRHSLGHVIPSRARALNAALNHLDSGVVVLGDPHVIATQTTYGVVKSQLQDPDQVLVPRPPAPGLAGVLAAHVETLTEVGGYLPAYVGHGAESPDLRLRLVRNNVTLLQCDLGASVATGHQVSYFGSIGLLNSRMDRMAGMTAQLMVLADKPRSMILGLIG